MGQPVQELIERYQNKLFAAAFQMCKNSEDAEDVVQDTFIQYHTSKKQFENEEHIRAWLLRVAINRAKNVNLTFWRRNRESLEDYMETLTYESKESEKVIVYFDGKEEEKDVTVTDLGNGDYGYSLEVDENEGAVNMEIVTDEEGNETKKFYSSSNEGEQTSEVTPLLVEEDGKVYLQFGDVKEDITEDYTDKTASGKMVIEGVEYEYEVTGTIDIYSITLESCE